ncbi:hypothetical protein H7J88_20755 [Mycolicibacterium flavescens]|uniref:Uncharacterized protein n=1 Tax=Mycolicibacterium flavescens TaxID=1776 RepID=A0A1E3R959_MYCFV|nr:hypothetical protein [Mycolicibacterium flavescens]MCV7282064.1 hypothetical protein [Mycolicibacterium flavescens]ODQ86468.1 hypothetical protein BHQ18_27010 [Mycolicibacterium flavescens]
MADDPLDDLYAAPLEEFTALRKRLAGEARKGGDADAAKRISGARKPTTAAWVVNRLAIADDSVARRLSELGQRLRDAHAAMDGDRIRELSAEQRRLVDDLAREALKGLKPTGALRDDVTGTLQAAVADPDVAARLGRLTKAETWSGFGEFGDTAIVVSPAARRKPEKTEKPEPEKPRDDREAAARRERQQARADLAAAEHARAEADDALAELQSDLATARMRHQDAQRRLQDAERGLSAAEDAYDQGKQASRDAAATVKEAKARLRRIT